MGLSPLMKSEKKRENTLVGVQTTKCLFEGVNTYAAMTTSVY